MLNWGFPRSNETKNLLSISKLFFSRWGNFHLPCGFIVVINAWKYLWLKKSRFQFSESLRHIAFSLMFWLSFYFDKDFLFNPICPFCEKNGWMGRKGEDSHSKIETVKILIQQVGTFHSISKQGFPPLRAWTTLLK